MSWVNLTSIVLQNQWQLSGEFEGQIIRLRHTVPENINFSSGLVAQSFDLDSNLELYNVKKIYPFNGDDVIEVLNPFQGKQRIAIKGSNRSRTPQTWRVSIDVWTGKTNLPTMQVQEVTNLIQQQNAVMAQFQEALEEITGNPIQSVPYTNNRQTELFLIN